MEAVAPTISERRGAQGSVLDFELRASVRAAIKTWIDVGVVAIAVVAAYLIRFEEIPTGLFGRQMVVLVAMLPLLRLATGRLAGTHRSSWRLFGLAETILLFRAVFIVSALMVVARVAMPIVVPDLQVVPFGVIALEGFLAMTLLVGVRVAVRLVDEQRARRAVRCDGGVRRALLVGAGRAGRMTARELRSRPDTGYIPVGFLDDDRQRIGQVIEGVRVLGSTHEAAAVAREVRADVVILTMPSVRRSQAKAVVERCREAGLPIQTVPGLYELISGRVGLTKIRPLRIEDLLGREVVAFDEAAVARVRNAFAGKRVLVTGAGGSIGSELCRQLAELGAASLVLVENNENNLFEIEQELRGRTHVPLHPCLADVRSPEDMALVFTEHEPQVVFHAAAYKHVPMMETHPIRAVDNNVRGTRIVAEAARRFGAERFVLVSTDKAVNPSSVMGATKRAAEMVVLAMAAETTTRFSVVRFGNVLGSKGSVLHTFQQQIEAGGPVTVTDPEITRFFMTIPEAVRLVLQAAAIGAGGEVFLLDMGEPIRIIDLARQMIRLAGYRDGEIPIEIVGLRPGEKLHEELLRDEEQAERSDVSGVLLSRGDVAPLANVSRWIERLEAAALRRDARDARRLLEATGYVDRTRPRATKPPLVDTLAANAEASRAIA